MDVYHNLNDADLIRFVVVFLQIRDSSEGRFFGKYFDGHER